MTTPETKGRSVGDLELVGGKWYILHRPIGSGLQAKWVHDQNVHNFLRSQGVRRVEGSGDNMKLYGQEDDLSPILDLSNQQDLDVFAGLYRGVVGPQDVATSAYEQGAPVDLEKLWLDIYGSSIPFPDIHATDEFGRYIPAAGHTAEKPRYVPDIQKYNEIIDALEARVGSLSRYGLDRDADYQLIDLGDQYESDIVISNGKVTKINKVTGAQDPTYTPGLREDIGAELPGYDVLQQPTGQLTPVQERVDPGYIIDPKTMQPYFQQPDGSLQAAPTPSIDDQISMHLVEGNMDAAVTKANFRDRPTSLEYFNAAMDWARTPADIFTISAIVRGIFEPTPGPMGELRRVGAPPAWATQAWVGLQNSMGIPTENMTSTPGAEAGTVNDMTVASSSGLVPNNFVSANSAPTTLDGGKTVTKAAVTPDQPPVAGDFDWSQLAEETDLGIDQGVGQGFAEAMGDVEPAGISAFDRQERVLPGSGTDLADMGGRRISMNDGSTPADIEAFFNGLNDKQKAFVNGWEGGIWTFASSAQNLQELERNLNFHFENAPETVGKVIPQVDGSFTDVTPEGERRIDFLNVEGEADALTALIDEGLITDIIDPITDIIDPTTGDVWDREPEYLGFGDRGDAVEQPFGRDEGFLDTGRGQDLSVEDAMAKYGWEDLVDDTDPYAPSPAFDPAGGRSRFELLMDAAAERDARREEREFDEGTGFDYGTFDSPYSVDPLDLSNTRPVRSEAKWGYNREGDLVVIEPSRIIGWEPIAEPRGPGQAQLDVEAGILPDEFALGSFGPAATGGGYEDIYQPFLLPERRHLPFDTEPRTFTVDAPPPDVIGFDPGMIASELGERRELPFTDSPDPNAGWQGYEPDVVPVTPMPFEITSGPATGPESFGPDVAPVPSFQMGDPLPTVEDFSAIASPEDYMGTGASEAAYWSDYLEGARGTRTDDRLTLVGESGPELALFPNGTEIIPLDRKMKPDQARRLRRRGEFTKAIDSFQFGGFVGDMGPEVTDLPLGAQTMPAGITEMMTGRPTRQPRSLMRQAGMRTPSAQTISNLLPEEIEVYREMGRMAGIPEKAFEREFRSMVPMGQGGTRQARFTPRGTGRTRYGNR